MEHDYRIIEGTPDMNRYDKEKDVWAFSKGNTFGGGTAYMYQGVPFIVYPDPQHEGQFNSEMDDMDTWKGEGFPLVEVTHVGTRDECIGFWVSEIRSVRTAAP